MIKFAEEYYQKDSTNTLDITGENYKYLVGVINEYDKNQQVLQQVWKKEGYCVKAVSLFLYFRLMIYYKFLKRDCSFTYYPIGG